MNAGCIRFLLVEVFRVGGMQTVSNPIVLGIWKNTFLWFVRPYDELVLDRLVGYYAFFRLLKTVCSPYDNIHVPVFKNSFNTVLYFPVSEATHFTVYFVTTLFKKLIIPLLRKFTDHVTT